MSAGPCGGQRPEALDPPPTPRAGVTANCESPDVTAEN